MIDIDREHTRLRKYSATTTGKRSVVRIELETDDPHELAFLLRELGELTEKQAASTAPRAPTRQAIGRRQLRLLPPPDGST